MRDLEVYQQKAHDLGLPESLATDLISAAFEGIVIERNEQGWQIKDPGPNSAANLQSIEAFEKALEKALAWWE